MAIFFVPFFFRLIAERRLHEPRSVAELRAEVAEGEKRSAELHARAVAELAARSSARGAHE
jgi:hypothetical protein